ncbi:putative lipase precursor [Aspergillus nomiae NRRL 13137]|uniref:feruloyl esterase n=1 Tax=Aspergillus nomiae NRRL (strain ATCC 15546 / NRRL 13137 / CBS 260.88 / M93) TaxID=1509407 RepID=A0A0L1J706_ASPN3|nr:putative lipase precursor [Aspergillus nomiae NRRL 13137]KNG87440.1 putative lipase precursor [Aspergillus nomiae NRRL 13137]
MLGVLNIIPVLLASQLLGSATLAQGRSVTSRSVSNEDLTEFQLFAQYSAAAYCDHNNDDGILGSIQCIEGVCPEVEAAGAETIAELNKDDIRGFVAVDDVHRLLVVSFRGSNSVRNWIKNFQFWTVDEPGPKGLWDKLFGSDKPQQGNDICSCSIHSGVYRSWELLKDDVMAALTQAREKHGDYHVVVTGHSLGGAIATVAGAYLRTKDIPCDIYTYGSPRVGDARFAEFVSTQPGITARITHGYDPVPSLPPMSLFGIYDLGYRHTWPEYWVPGSSANGTDSIQVCSGMENLSCDGARETGISFDVEDHRQYFGQISACGPKFTYRDTEDTWSAKDMERLRTLAANDNLFAAHSS